MQRFAEKGIMVVNYVRSNCEGRLIKSPKARGIKYMQKFVDVCDTWVRFVADSGNCKPLFVRMVQILEESARFLR